LKELPKIKVTSIYPAHRYGPIKGAKLMFQAHIFRPDGSMFTDKFETEELAEQFCKNHGLELFKTEKVYVKNES
jgi:hypothetical protein